MVRPLLIEWSVNREALCAVLIGVGIVNNAAWLARPTALLLIADTVLRANERAGSVALKENLSVVRIQVVKNDLAIRLSGTTGN